MMQSAASTEIQEGRERFKKLLLANQDAFEARDYIRRAVAFGDPELLARDETVARAAFVAAFVIAYGRSFVSSRSKKKLLPGFADHFAGTLSAPEANLHQRLRDLRDQEFAHSDADVASINVCIINDSTLAPVSRVLRIHSLTYQDISAAAGLVERLIIFLTEEMIALQAALGASGGF